MPIPSLVQQKGPNAGKPIAGSPQWLKEHLAKWDKGSRVNRYHMLEAFAAKFNPSGGGGIAAAGGGSGGGGGKGGWGGQRRGRTTDAERSPLGGDGSGIQGLNRGRFTPAHVLEREYGGAASLFLTRITAWLRTSYLMHHPIAPMLDCIAPFLTSATTGGSHFLEQFIELGGIVIALDILTIRRVSPADKLRALRVLEMVAEAGMEYKRRICESPGGPIDIIVGYLADSAAEDDGMQGLGGGGGDGGGGGSPGAGGFRSPTDHHSNPRLGQRGGGGGGAGSPVVEGHPPSPTGGSDGTGKEPPMLHAQRLLVMLGTDNPTHSADLERKVGSAASSI